MTLPNRSRAWKTTVTAVSGTPSSTQTFTLGRTNGMPTLPATICVVKRGQDANPGTHEEITVTTMSGSNVTACTRAVNGTSAISLEVGDGAWQSLAAILDAYDSAIGASYVVDGVAYPATRAGILAAATAASGAGGGHVVIARDITSDTTSFAYPATGNVEISGLPGVVISAPLAGAANLFTATGTLSATSVVASNIARRARSVPHNQTAGLTFARGDYIKITDSTTQSHQARVVAVSGAAPQTVVFDLPTSVAFTTANSATVAKMTPVPGLYIHDLSFDNNSNTSAVRAIIGTNLAEDRWENLTFTGFKGSGLTGGDAANAFSLVSTYQSSRRHIKVYDSGTLGVAAVQHSNNTRSLDEDYEIVGCGVAFNQLFANHFTMRSVHVTYSGEGIVLGSNATNAGVTDGVLEDCWAHHITAGGTGFRVRGGVAYCEFTDCGAYACDSDGLYLVGLATPEHHLTFNNCRFEGNAVTSGVDIELQTTTTAPYAIEFSNTTYGTKTDTGIGTVWNNTLPTTGASIVNSTTRTFLLQKLLYPGQMTLYNAFEGCYTGIIANNAGNRQITFELQLGATAQIIKTTAVIGASASNRPFEVHFAVRNNGATNVQNMRMTVLIGLPTAGETGDGTLATAAPLLGPQPLYAAGAVDTTAATSINLVGTCLTNDFTVAAAMAWVRRVG